MAKARLSYPSTNSIYCTYIGTNITNECVGQRNEIAFVCVIKSVLCRIRSNAVKL